MRQDKKHAPLQNIADKHQISPQASSEVPESITNTVTEDDFKLQIGREPVTQTQSKELESHNVERSQASDCQGHEDSDTGVNEDDHTEYGSIANSTILSKWCLTKQLTMAKTAIYVQFIPSFQRRHHFK